MNLTTVEVIGHLVRLVLFFFMGVKTEWFCNLLGFKSGQYKFMRICGIFGIVCDLGLIIMQVTGLV